MGKSRTHVSIKTSTYKDAKKIVEEYASMGINITMEEAIYQAKQRQRERSGGWFI